MLLSRSMQLPEARPRQWNKYDASPSAVDKQHMHTIQQTIETARKILVGPTPINNSPLARNRAIGPSADCYVCTERLRSGAVPHMPSRDSFTRPVLIL